MGGRVTDMIVFLRNLVVLFFLWSGAWRMRAAVIRFVNMYVFSVFGF